MGSVSVIIPCYNYAHFLPECVESVLSQNGVDVRVLIIDDSSTDNTPEVAVNLVGGNSNAEYRRHEKNLGHIATYNEGLAWASADYTILLSADDMLTPGALMRSVQLMDAHPEVGFVCGGCVRFDTDKPLPQPRNPSGLCKWQIEKGLDWLETLCRTGINRIASPEVLVRTSLQKQLGGYRAELPHSGDMEMWMRFAVHADVGCILDADQAFYRLHKRNMHVRQFSATFKEVQQRRLAFDFVFQEYKEIIPDWERLQKLAYRSLAGDALWAVCQAVYRRETKQAPVMELIRFGINSHGGKFFDPNYLLVYFGLIKRFLQSARRRLGSSGGQA